MHRPAAILVAVVGSLAAGVVLSYGQSLPAGGFAPLFNSALPVVTLAAVVALAGQRLWTCVALAASAGPLAMVGYYTASTLRGFGASTSSVVLWVGAGLLAGSVMGAAVWTMRQGPSAAPGPGARGFAVGYWPGMSIASALGVAAALFVAYGPL